MTPILLSSKSLFKVYSLILDQDLICFYACYFTFHKFVFISVFNLPDLTTSFNINYGPHISLWTKKALRRIWAYFLNSTAKKQIQISILAPFFMSRASVFHVLEQCLLALLVSSVTFNAAVILSRNCIFWYKF